MVCFAPAVSRQQLMGNDQLGDGGTPLPTREANIRHAGASTVLRINSGWYSGDGQRPSYRWKTVSR